ncbi:FtsX-like permease family protein [uncultured Parabacteroides sp.]|uniref:FtsX-like permease family protein n=1 Tax=uncultured Parabacteroides sp. TaxID=512312 RepID=UPI0025F311C4|nr:FtsX-like permease family protein [uncultured Parabacteroides sp.]
MRNLNIAIRSLFKRGRHNMMKIVSLSVGLSVALVLIAKIYFERSYDTFYPDADRIYQIYENYNQSGKELDYYQVSGAVAPGMLYEVPGVEAATRLTYIGGDNTLFTTPDKERYSARFIMMADSNVFDLFPRPILSGNPKEILAKPWYAMVSRSLAEKMGGIGKVEGMTIIPDENPGLEVTIGGVFEDIPENASLRYDMLVSMAGMDKESLNNWLGNDRYKGYVRLMPGVAAESLTPAIHDMALRHQDAEVMRKAGMELTYTLKPILDLHKKTDEVKSMVMMLAILALALLFTAVMNYILIAISSIVNRTKEIAVHKSYGASEGNIHNMMMSETLVHMVCSIVLAVFLIFLGRDMIHDLLDVSVEGLLLSKGALILLAVCVVVFLVTGFVPGALFARIPVAAAFRNFRESRRVWKLGLLFLQFIAAGFLVTLLLIVGRQHIFMVNSNPGYSYDRLAYCSISGTDSTTRYKMLDELMRIPEVEAVTTSYALPLWDSMSGNNIALPESGKELFNIADQYWVGNGFLKLMEIPVIEGRSFTENVSKSDEVMVNRAFVEKMKEFTDWSDGPVGKSIYISEHDHYDSKYYTICGVYENYRIGTLISQDDRPSILFYRQRPLTYLHVKFHQVTPEAVERVNDKLQELMPDRDPRLSLYSVEMVNLYSSSRKFRDQVLIGGIITLLISMIGLIGYTNDEVNRRRKELAIRKVNGATLKDILSIFLTDILWLALPAIIIGCAVSYFVAERWLQQFVEKIPLSPWMFISGGLFVSLVVVGCIIYRTWDAANDDPVNSLKSE